MAREKAGTPAKGCDQLHLLYGCVLDFAFPWGGPGSVAFPVPSPLEQGERIRSVEGELPDTRGCVQLRPLSAYR
jgi:hypothetical protein